MADEQQHFVPPTMTGVVYWKDHVLGIIDKHSRAEEAVAALQADGFSAEDARAWTGEFVTENHRYYVEHRGRLRSLGASIPSAEGDVMQEYATEAGKGHSIVTVRASKDAEARQVAKVLRQHGAHHLVHYRGNSLVDL